MGNFARKLGRTAVGGAGSDKGGGETDAVNQGRRRFRLARQVGGDNRAEHHEEAVTGIKVANILKPLLSSVDITEVFKTKGDLKRWSAKRTIGGLIVSTACYMIVETSEATWPLVTMCLIGVIPLIVSLAKDE